MSGYRVQRSTGWALAAFFCLALTGCRHKRVPVMLPVQAQSPVPLTVLPEPAEPAMVQTQPLPVAPVVAVKPPKKPRRKPSAPKVAAPAPPVQVAAVAAPDAASVIGALSAGGETGSQKHQEAQEMVSGLNKRLGALPAALQEQEKTQISLIRNFTQQAQVALNSGDLDGAVTLATKARLLLDDLLKK